MIKAVNIAGEVAKLNKALGVYVDANGRSLDVLIPQRGGKLAWAMYRRLRDIAPPKGSVRNRGNALLSAGRGLRIRDSIRNKALIKFGARTDVKTRQVKLGRQTVTSRKHKLNWYQYAAQLELSARESQRGFLSITPPRDAAKLTPGASVSTTSRWGLKMATAGYQTATGTKTLKLAWGTQGRTSEKAAEGLTYSQRAKTATAAAIADTTADMEQYIARKLAESLAEVKP